MRAATTQTVSWYVAVGLLSALLALVPEPTAGNPCQGISDLAWLAWLFRINVWLNLAFTLPIAVAISVLVVWRWDWRPARGVAAGVTIGMLIAVGLVVGSILGAHCSVTVDLVPG